MRRVSPCSCAASTCPVALSGGGLPLTVLLGGCAVLAPTVPVATFYQNQARRLAIVSTEILPDCEGFIFSQLAD